MRPLQVSAWTARVAVGLRWSCVFVGLGVPWSDALSFDPLPSPSLDLSNLGRVGLVGDFNAISLYNYRQQSEDAFSSNGSQSILTPLPNGAFATLATADADIQAMCPFVMKNGALAGIIVAGNFTSLAGVEAQGVALFNATSAQVTPLPGISGKVAALLCDQDTNRVYVGGEFRGANSTNAIAWLGQTGWTNLPFAGFNGPVRAIAKAATGQIVFAGAFDGLGNATGPGPKDQQIINLGSANITAHGTTTTAGFDDPRNLVCKTTGTDGPGNTWRLADHTPGAFRAEFRFGFRPTKLRVWNTRLEGRGTKVFRFTALPLNGIMNLTFTDPGSGANASCDARCPLSNDGDAKFQDFRFVNVVGMSAFQIDISDWYGSGGGLDGIEIFQDDIYAFAINDFNEPACANVGFAANGTSTGPWAVTPSRNSSSEYLTAHVAPFQAESAARAVFTPNIREPGNYSVTLYTPGCLQDDSCASRGQVNITGTMATGTRQAGPVATELFQTNNFDKYDQIYQGYVDASTGAFRPTVTLTPSAGQDGGNITVVAQRVRFELLATTGGLNGLYEFDPNRALADTAFADSAIDQAGIDSEPGARMNALIVVDQATYFGGNFTHGNVSNIARISGQQTTALTGGGLNGEVHVMLRQDQRLYVGGDFTNTSHSDTPGLNHVAAYSIANASWQALGAGVNGRVDEIVPLSLNVTRGNAETVVSLSGPFDQLLSFGGQAAVAAPGFAIWVPSRQNWLSNLDADTPALSGRLTMSASAGPGGLPLFAGSLSSQGLAAAGAVGLLVSGPLSLERYPLRLQAAPLLPGPRRRAATVNGQNVTGVVTAAFYESSRDRNITVFAGHFTAKGRDGSTIDNLLFVNHSNTDTVTGLGPGISGDSAFLAVDIYQDVLYAGGSVTGQLSGAKVNGLILYDLAAANYVSSPPPAFSGPGEVVVTAIAQRPSSGEVYVGGNFELAGSLGCPSVCVYNSPAAQWNRPGTGLGGSVGAMAWASHDKLVVGGNLTVNGTATSMASYDPRSLRWTGFDGAASVPGPVTALSPADDLISTFWVAGAAANGSAFLMKYDGTRFHAVGDSLGPSTRIRSLQVLPLSKPHQATDLLRIDQTLLVAGQLELPGFGNASVAVFNGTTFTPLVLSTTDGDAPGSMSQFVSAKHDFFSSSAHHLAVGFVVLIGLAIALGLIFLVVVAGILLERRRRRREGYMLAPTRPRATGRPTAMFEKNDNLRRIPPAHLFSSLGRAGGSPGSRAPMI
ncbi:MAG: hypothetical protein M1826_000114 [Phylliscum demangeonii]|nr:MAG: hypothetical protein M1826_000114 [Phylliscum demangeonii]